MTERRFSGMSLSAIRFAMESGSISSQASSRSCPISAVSDRQTPESSFSM